jgi:uncharacterized protein with von Willebrand factor type A (vWA) domain
MVSWMNCENQFATVISVPIMWQTGQRLDSHLAAFPLYLSAPVLERKPLPLFQFHNVLIFSVVLISNKRKRQLWP